MMLVSIGDQVEAGTYCFHSWFARAVNFERNGRLVSVVDEDIGPGPLSIVLRGRKLRTGQAVAHPLEIGNHTVVFEGHRFSFERRHRYHSALEWEAGGLKPINCRSIPKPSPRSSARQKGRRENLNRFQQNLPVFEELLKSTAPPGSLAFLLDKRRLVNFRAGFERAFARQAMGGVRCIFHGSLLKGIGSLKGCGVGLTPSGDDFIAGLLIGLNLLQEMHGRDYQPIADAIFNAAQGNNIFSNTFLDLARQGRLFGRMKDLILSLRGGSRNAVEKSAKKLFAIGESSGADLGTGFWMTVQDGVGTAERWKEQSLTIPTPDSRFT